MQSNNNNQKNLIHCKVTFNDDIRRFEFHGTEFTQLKNHVSSLIGLPTEGFVLQYVDDESDLINLSSNEDFAIAVEISGGLVRLIASSGSAPSAAPAGKRRQYRKQYQGYGKGGKERSSPEEKHKNKVKLLKDFLATMPADEACTPQQAKRKEHLRVRIQKAESSVVNWQERVNRRNSNKRKRWERKEQKKDRKSSKQFTPEVEQQIKELKTQINSLKPAARELRIQKKQKKVDLENSLQNGTGDKDAILQEIVDIKEKQGQLYAQMKPLRDNIRALKGKQ
jgi:chromosome segregation ATPase